MTEHNPKHRGLVIREASAEDASGLVKYLYKVGGESDFLTFGEGEIEIPIEREKALIEDAEKSPNKIFVIAELDGKIVGNLLFTGGMRHRTMHAGEFGITVLKDYWNMGIGRELLNYMIKWAKSSGIIRKINLKVRSDNERAKHLYREVGFIEEGVITRDMIIDGIFYDSIIMGLKIDPLQ